MPTSERSMHHLQTLKTYLMLSRDVDISNTSAFGRLRIVINFPTQSFLFYLTDERLVGDDLLKAVWAVIQDPKETICKFQGPIGGKETNDQTPTAHA